MGKACAKKNDQIVAVDNHMYPGSPSAPEIPDLPDIPAGPE